MSVHQIKSLVNMGSIDVSLSNTLGVGNVYVTLFDTEWFK